MFQQFMNGLFLLDKPIGISSNLALQKVKRVLKVKKAGHAGTLDPLATGMLPIAFNEATKFLQYLLDADKTYAVTMKLGERTTTSDAEGEIILTRDVPLLSTEKINAVLNHFRGAIQQIPSMFSALKHNGVPLYEYARKGIEIDRPARSIRIDDLKITSIENEFVSMVVSCSKGTYIRTLVDDVGEMLGCGAHVTQLRRLSVANFSERQMITLEKLQAICEDQESLRAHLLPIENCLSHFPALVFPEFEKIALNHGKVVLHPDANVLGNVTLFDENQHFFGMGEILPNQRVSPKRLFSQ
jgi:tRNA pseudouridine55 synthase